MGGEWKVQSCSSESPVHKADNVVREELYRIWQTEEPSEEAWLVLETDPPKAIERLEIVNAGASLIELYGLPEDGSEEELLLSTQQVMTLKDLTNKTNRTRSFTYAIPQKLSPIAAQKRWKQLRVICRQPFGTKEHRACIGLSRIDVVSCNTEASVSQPIVETSMIQEVRKLKDCSTNKSSRVNGSNSLVSCGSSDRLIDNKNAQGDVSKRKLPVWNIATKDSAEDSSGDSGDNCDPTEEKKIKIISENSEGNIKDATGDSTGKGGQIESKDNVLSRDVSKINSSTLKTTTQEKKQKTSSNLKDPASNMIAASSSHGPILSGSSEVDQKKGRIQRKPDLGSFSALLDGVVFAISGLVNPERGNLRSQALQMGAEYQPDWNSNCTLLVCAFPNTPKFLQVKGDGGTIVSKEWISECYKKKKPVDIDPYLMHVGKPWRKLQPVTPLNESEQTKKKPTLHGRTVNARINTPQKKTTGVDESMSDKLDINLSEVQKWVVEDFNDTVSWLEKLPEKPKSSELKEAAIEGIKACLEDAAKCLVGNKPVHTIFDDWEFIPRVVKELAALEDPRKASQTISREELCKVANNYKAIYDTELENMRRVIQENKGMVQRHSTDQHLRVLDKHKATVKNSRLSNTSKSDTDSDDTIIMGEDELEEAEAAISKKYQ